MTLHDFINKRLEELGMRRSDLVEKFDIHWNTLTDIKRGKRISEATQQKLALGLKCSQGDIQAALANTPHPLREEAEKKEGLHKESVMATVDKLEEIVAAQKPYVVPAAALEPEPEPAEVFEQESDMEFPPEEEPEETLAEFKARLMQILVEEILVTESSLTNMVFQQFGKRVIQELKKAGTEE